MKIESHSAWLVAEKRWKRKRRGKRKMKNRGEKNRGKEKEKKGNNLVLRKRCNIPIETIEFKIGNCARHCRSHEWSATKLHTNWDALAVFLHRVSARLGCKQS